MKVKFLFRKREILSEIVKNGSEVWEMAEGELIGRA